MNYSKGCSSLPPGSRIEKTQTNDYVFTTMKVLVSVRKHVPSPSVIAVNLVIVVIAIQLLAFVVQMLTRLDLKDSLW